MRNDYNWPAPFREIYDAAVKRYQGGRRTPAQLFDQPQLEFLATIGCTGQELFDFVEDGVQWGEPSYETVLLITAVRREYFLTVQQGKLSRHLVDMDRLPAKDQAVDGIAWLPRIILKARAKLRGEMPPELMYCCGGDRQFLQGMDIAPADFLRVVWNAGDNDRQIIDYVKARKVQR